MNFSGISHFIAIASILFSLAAPVLAGAGMQDKALQTRTEPRDEKLWQKALAIHKKAIVIDTHNDVTTPMTNDDYDLGGTPPAPYRTSIERKIGRASCRERV